MDKRQKYALGVNYEGLPTTVNVDGFPLGIGGDAGGPSAFPFILSIDTTLTGTSNSDQFTLPLRAGETYDFIATVDGVDQAPHTTDSSPTYTFATAGVNTLEIRSTNSDTTGFPGVHFNFSGDRLKVLDLIDWGTMEWTSFKQAFYGCANMDISATGMVPVGTATDFSNTFRDAFGSFIINATWDFSNATTLENFALTSGIVSFEPAGNLDNVTTMKFMCLNCTSLTTVSQLSAAVCLDGTSAFQNTGITEVKAHNFPLMTTASSMFRDCDSLTLVQNITWGSLLAVDGMFRFCAGNIIFVGIMDFSTVTDTSFMLQSTAIVTAPLWDLSAVTQASNMFNGCGSLIWVPNYTLTALLDITEMFLDTTALKVLPDFNQSTGLVTDFTSVLQDSGITEIPDWDVSGGLTFLNAFNGCSDLEYKSRLFSKFNGSDTRITLGTAWTAPDADWSAECNITYIAATSILTYGTLLAEDGISFGVRSDNFTVYLDVYVGTTFHRVSSTTAMNDGNLHTVKATYVKSTNLLTLYIDDVSEGSGTVVMDGNQDIKYFGARSDTFAFHEGNIADFKIYEGDNLRRYYKINEDLESVTTVIDYGSDQANGTASGTFTTEEFTLTDFLGSEMWAYGEQSLALSTNTSSQNDIVNGATYTLTDVPAGVSYNFGPGFFAIPIDGVVVATGTSIRFRNVSASDPVVFTPSVKQLHQNSWRGVEILTNGDFATDTVWDKGAGWTISEGEAHSVATSININQTIGDQLGNTVHVEFDITSFTAGSDFRAEIGGAQPVLKSDIGRYVADILPTDATGNLFLFGASSTVSIDNITAKHILIGTALTSPPTWTLKAAASINAGYMFRACSSMKIPMTLENSDSITSYDRTYNSCVALTLFPEYDYTNATNMILMMQSTNIVVVDELNIPSATNIFGLFLNCSLLEEVNNITTASSLVTITSFVSGCSVLNSVSLFDTTGVTAAAGAFKDTALTELPAFVWTANIDFATFLEGTALDTANYDALLVAIDANGLSNGTLHGGNSLYTDAVTRLALEAKTWTIDDGGQLAALFQYALDGNDTALTRTGVDDFRIGPECPEATASWYNGQYEVGDDSAVIGTGPFSLSAWVNTNDSGNILHIADGRDAAIPELVTNGTDITTTTGWVEARGVSTLSAVGGNIRATSDSAATFGMRPAAITTVIGRRYKASVKVTRGDSTGTIIAKVSNNAAIGAPVEQVVFSSPTDGFAELNFIATATTTYIGAVQDSHGSGQYFELGEVSIRETTPEEVTNGTFDVNVDDWIEVAGATSTFDSGTCQVTGAVVTGIYQTVATIIGQSYLVEYESTQADGNHRLRIGSGVGIGFNIFDGPDSAVPVKRQVVFTAITITSTLYLRNSAANLTINWDNISVTEVDSAISARLLADGTVSLNNLGADKASIATVNDGTWHHVCATVASPLGDLIWYIDGVAETPLVAEDYDLATLASWTLGVASTNPVGFWNGGLDGVQLHNRALTQAEVTALQTRCDFTPLLTEAWYDASDANTIIESGGAISQWDDKSVNGRDLTQATGTRQPIYDLAERDVTFDNTDALVLGAGITGLTDHDFYSVRKSSNDTSIDISASSGIYSYVADDASVSTSILANIGTPDLYVNGEIENPVDRDDVHTVLNTGLDIIQGYLGCDFTTWTDFKLSYNTTDFSFVGSMREVILVANLSTADRQKVEGYLAWKWGLVANLPIGHPYKLVPPLR